MNLVFLLEEESTKYLLDSILPKILPEGVSFRTIPHQGKSHLRASIPKKLSKWNVPDTKFIIIQDQDSNDCMKLKAEIAELCSGTEKPVLIRIACHEMEAWYFGDLRAVSAAYGRDLTYLEKKKKYRDPDQIIGPKRELRHLVPEHEQIAGAKKIGPLMDMANNRSGSFNALIQGIQKFIDPV